MRTERKLFALLATMLMIGWVVSPVGAVAAAAADNTSLSVGVTQNDDGTATVTVTETENNTTGAVENASVVVDVLDENATYAGAGEYTTGANGTVTLPEPNETVNVSVTASVDNHTASTEATLSPATDENESEEGNTTNFGERVSSFVHEIQNDSNVTHIGPMVANFVLEHNPGNAPDHAGPPEWLTNESVNKTRGPPDHAGPPENKTQGPPENKTQGPPDNKTQGPPDNKSNGPPDDRGPSDEEDDEDEDDSEESVGVVVQPRD